MTSLTRIEWARAEATHPDETESGDGSVILDVEGGISLLAVVDGLGHGPEAATTTRTALRVLESVPWTPAEAIDACHRALRGTRGVVMTCVRIELEAGRLRWAGVGNVDAVLQRRADGGRERLMIPGGIVGHHLPRLREEEHPVAEHDALVLVTDGIGPRFAESIDVASSPAELAERLLADHGTGNDDALVVVGRIIGERGP